MLSALFSSMPAFAQRWTLDRTPADELKGTDAISRHYIELPGRGVVVIYDDKDILGFYTSRGIFDYKPNNYVWNRLNNSPYCKGLNLNRYPISYGGLINE